MGLAADMTRWVGAARARLAQAPRDALTAVSVDLVAHTPIDKGILVDSWYADGTPQVPDAPDKTGAGSLARLTAAAQSLPLGGQFMCSTAVPYSVFVEFGTSRMAPRAYLRGTLARAPAVAAAAIARGAHGQP